LSSGGTIPFPHQAFNMLEEVHAKRVICRSGLQGLRKLDDSVRVALHRLRARMYVRGNGAPGRDRRWQIALRFGALCQASKGLDRTPALSDQRFRERQAALVR